MSIDRRIQAMPTVQMHTTMSSNTHKRELCIWSAHKAILVDFCEPKIFTTLGKDLEEKGFAILRNYAI